MNIFVSNLGFHVESNDLKDFFTPYGEVTSSKVITDRETGRSRGFGFVEMPNDTAGNEAISKLNGTVVEGRAMSVNVARPKEKSNKLRFF
jgi:RNA recognition motif-containing protein